ncbi:hypothetical protein BDW62DRAFT_205053 [Aspergillus aurantiobrunneus]
MEFAGYPGSERNVDGKLPASVQASSLNPTESDEAKADAFAGLLSLLNPDEIITPKSPDYTKCIQTWAAQKQLHPRIVVWPTSVECLSRVISHLYSADLDFAIYGHGFMSASANDVLVNMAAFNDFHFDKHSELVTVGAGQAWRDVYRKLRNVAPEYAVVGSRTPAVGVAGTIMTGGQSWLSGEHGCISDPANMLDAKVVLYDGSVVWASSQPDLLWALRGGGGAVVQVVLRVFKYPQNIWAGPILIPRDRLEQLADGVAKFVSQPVDPKVTMLLYVVKKRLLASMGAQSDMLLIHAFDALGEAHGRSSFRWALDIPGAIDQTKMTNLTGVIGLQDKADVVKGSMKQFWAPLMLPELTKETVMNAIEWSEEIQRLDESLADCTYLILGLLSMCDPAGSASGCAWPRPKGMRHFVLLGTGCPSDAGPEKERLAQDLAIQSASRVLGSNGEPHRAPSGLEDFQDIHKIWGPHFPRLQALRRQYDPRARFKGAIPVELK